MTLFEITLGCCPSIKPLYSRRCPWHSLITVLALINNIFHVQDKKDHAGLLHISVNVQNKALKVQNGAIMARCVSVAAGATAAAAEMD